MSLYSDCCSAPPDKTFDCLCSTCKEHCEFWDDEEERRHLAEIEAGIPFESIHCNSCGGVGVHCDCKGHHEKV